MLNIAITPQVNNQSYAISVETVNGTLHLFARTVNITMTSHRPCTILNNSNEALVNNDSGATPFKTSLNISSSDVYNSTLLTTESSAPFSKLLSTLLEVKRNDEIASTTSLPFEVSTTPVSNVVHQDEGSFIDNDNGNINKRNFEHNSFVEKVRQVIINAERKLGSRLFYEGNIIKREFTYKRRIVTCSYVPVLNDSATVYEYQINCIQNPRRRLDYEYLFNGKDHEVRDSTDNYEFTSDELDYDVADTIKSSRSIFS